MHVLLLAHSCSWRYWCLSRPQDLAHAQKGLTACQPPLTGVQRVRLRAQVVVRGV